MTEVVLAYFYAGQLLKLRFCTDLASAHTIEENYSFLHINLLHYKWAAANH